MRREYWHWCAECGEIALDSDGKKASDLKRGKIKNIFCSHRCAMNHRSNSRAYDRCKRCDKTRKELAHYAYANIAATGVSFCNGYCPRCYQLRKFYNDDENLIQSHEITQQLIKENANDKRQKYRRPPQNATGNH